MDKNKCPICGNDLKDENCEECTSNLCAPFQLIDEIGQYPGHIPKYRYIAGFDDYKEDGSGSLHTTDGKIIKPNNEKSSDN